MGDEGRIASRIFSKHLKVEDEYYNEQEENDENTHINMPLSNPEDVEHISKGEENNESGDSVISDIEKKTSNGEGQDEQLEKEAKGKLDPIPHINLEDEFVQAMDMGGNLDNIPAANELIKGDDEMQDEREQGTQENSQEEENTTAFEFDNTEDEGETLVLNFGAPSIPSEVHQEILEKTKVEEEEHLNDIFIGSGSNDAFEETHEEHLFVDTEPKMNFFDENVDAVEENTQTTEFEPQVEEFPKMENVLVFNGEHKTDDFAQGENFNFVESDESGQQPTFDEPEKVEVPQNIMLFNENEEQPELSGDFETQEEDQDEVLEGVIESPQFELIDSETADEDISFEVPVVNSVEQADEAPGLNEFDASYTKDLTEEEQEVDSLADDFPQLEDMSSEVKDFLLNNIDFLGKDRIAICVELGLPLEDLKGFFVGSLKGEDKERVYNKLREIEIQHLFENFIYCFNVESLTRKKETIDGKIVNNIVKLKDNIFIDGYSGLNEASDIEVKQGESIFVLSHELEINVENYLDEIKVAKLNANSVYLLILDGAIVDDEAIKLATRYGVRIVDMDIPISTVNKNLEVIKRGIIV